MQREIEVLELISQILLRCIVMGIIVLLFWWGVLAAFGDWAYEAHSGFIPITREQFNAIHYAGILLTKSALGFLFVIPYVAIRLVIKKRAAG